eukprot:2805079-Amphidinium_carterae.1
MGTLQPGGLTKLTSLALPLGEPDQSIVGQLDDQLQALCSPSSEASAPQGAFGTITKDVSLETILEQ